MAVDKKNGVFALRLIIGGMLVCLLCSEVRAADPQSPPAAKNSAYFEILGNGMLYSVNYDRLLTRNLSFRIGIMELPFSKLFQDEKEEANLFMLPIMANLLLGSGKHKLELGGGVAVGWWWHEIVITETATLGYRYQQGHEGSVFRIGYTPFRNEKGSFSWGGISFGMSF